VAGVPGGVEGRGQERGGFGGPASGDTGTASGTSGSVGGLGEGPAGSSAGDDTGPGIGDVGVGGSVGSNATDVAGVGGSDAAGSDTVICSELYRQHRIDDRTIEADRAFGRWVMRHDPNALAGYLFWARPYVRLMRHPGIVGWLATRAILPLALPWAREMAHRIADEGQGSRFGAFLIAVGMAPHRWLGAFVRSLSKGVSAHVR